MKTGMNEEKIIRQLLKCCIVVILLNGIAAPGTSGPEFQQEHMDCNRHLHLTKSQDNDLIPIDHLLLREDNSNNACLLHTPGPCPVKI